MCRLDLGLTMVRPNKQSQGGSRASPLRLQQRLHVGRGRGSHPGGWRSALCWPCGWWPEAAGAANATHTHCSHAQTLTLTGMAVNQDSTVFH